MKYLEAISQAVAYVFLSLMLSGCVMGSGHSYDLEHDLSPEELQHLQELVAENPTQTVIENRIYSIPIIPIYFQSRNTELAKATLPMHQYDFKIYKLQGLLYTLLFATVEKARYNDAGENLSLHEENGILLGLIFRNWSGWHSRVHGVEGELYSGFSIAWGLLGYEQDRGEETFRFFWLRL